MSKKGFGGGAATFVKRFKTEGVIGIVSISLLSLSYAFPENTASSMTKAVLWGFLGTFFFIAICVILFLWSRLHKKNSVGGGAAGTATSSHGLGSAFFDAITNPLTWLWWTVIFGGVWLYNGNFRATPNWTWIPLFLWALYVLVARARMSSKEKNGGKEKKAAPGLTSATMIIGRLAFLSTLAVIAYYALLAPTGTWEKLAGKSATEMVYTPGKMVIPKGVPLNPNFTSNKLEDWNVTYVAANPQYRVRQSAWGGKKVTLLTEPGREVTEVVNLTVSFDAGDPSLEIHLSGSCQAVMDNRKPGVSKTCAGWWRDRGGVISGQFYLEVKEGGHSRYFDAYLYDGNYLPRERNLTMLLFSGPPIPHIMLQFRPKDWSAENG